MPTRRTSCRASSQSRLRLTDCGSAAGESVKWCVGRLAYRITGSHVSRAARDVEQRGERVSSHNQLHRDVRARVVNVIDCKVYQDEVQILGNGGPASSSEMERRGEEVS